MKKVKTSFTEKEINQDLLTIESTKKIINIMENTVFEVNVNNKKKKALLLKVPFGKNTFTKILIIFYEGKTEEINNIKIEKKSLSINAKIKIDNKRKIYYIQNLVFIEIKPNDKIKENAFLSVEEKNENEIIIKTKHMNSLFYSDIAYFLLDNKYSPLNIPNFIPFKESILNIIVTPESHKVVSINFYPSLYSWFLFKKEFIIENTNKLIFQENKIKMNIFSKIIYSIFKPNRNEDLYDKMSKITSDSDNSETQLDSGPSKESEKTELNAFFEFKREDSIISHLDSKEENKEEKQKINKSLCNIVYTKNNNTYSIGSGFFIKLRIKEEEKYFLMTCEHMIDSQMIYQNDTIKIIYNQKKTNNIELNRNKRIIQDFKFLNIDATIIEIIEKHIINEIYFLSPYMADINEIKDKEISIANNLNQKLYTNSGSLLSINPLLFSFNHSLKTNDGSSGSPIFLKDTEYVIGLHTGKNKENNLNLGNFIHPIVSIICNGNPLYEIRKNGNLEYEGEMKDNMRDGYGKSILEKGNYYIGEWKNGIKQGKGTIYSKNNSIIYQGDFENDKYNGNGKFIEENGSYYIGQWKNGKKHGVGRSYNQNNNLIYEGNFEDGKFSGFGKYKENNDKYYIGEWNNNQKVEGIEINEKDKEQIYTNNNNNTSKYLYQDDKYFLES